MPKNPASSETTFPPPGRGLYCNRTLNMRSIRAVGYDMDYTLVHYHSERWERRAYQHLRRRLREADWPVDDLRFDPGLVMRGLVIDCELGNVLKVNRFGFVKQAQHGTEPLGPEAVRQLYAREIVELASPRYAFANTLFSLSEGCLFAQLVDRLDQGAFAAGLSYRDLYRQIRTSTDAAHMEGRLKAEIMARPERFVVLDDEAALALLDQRHAGKKLLLITNSDWPYTDSMMSYAYDRFLPKGMRWRELFDLVLVAARKPSFFESRAPALRIVDAAGLLQPHVGPLEPGSCYFGGSAHLVEEALGLSGDQILYVGDHVYADVHVSKSVLRWRTALVLRELEPEIAAVERMRAQQLELGALMADKERLEWQHYQLRLRLQRRRKGYARAQDDSPRALQRRMAKLRDELVALDRRIGPLAEAAAKAHSPRWGLMMRAGNDKSQLARQVEQYADVYTSRVSNFLFATPFAYLRSPRGNLPHDPAS